MSLEFCVKIASRYQCFKNQLWFLEVDWFVHKGGENSPVLINKYSTPASMVLLQGKSFKKPTKRSRQDESNGVKKNFTMIYEPTATEKETQK